MKRSLMRCLAAAGVVLSTAACGDFLTNLETENPNQPDLERALAEPADVESLIRSSWRPYFDYTQGAQSFNLSVSPMAHEVTSTISNWGNLDWISEPRTQPFNNSPTYTDRWFAQEPWTFLYGGLASTNDGMRQLNRGIRITEQVGTTTVDNTPRARAFGKYTQGILLGLLALYYDQASIATERSNMQDPAVAAYHPYPVVRDSALASLREAVQIAQANQFTIPETWIPGVTLTNQDLARLANTYIARIMAYTPRSPQERAAVDWNAVVTHLDQGITTNFVLGGPGIGGIPAFRSNYKAFIQSTGWFRMDYRTIGPADVSGQYQQWINAPVAQRTWFTITTPDRRVAGANRTTDPGTYFGHLGTIANPTITAATDQTRPSYKWSRYAFRRFGTPAYPVSMLTISTTELDLLRAEAHFRGGRMAEAAALVNRSRTANGMLPPVTAAGVPAGADCVPRKPNGACGDLWDALMYEKHIEGVGLEAPVAWFDRRGWGTLASGTMVHMPVPGRELSTLGHQMYTFGGGGPGSAP